MFWLITTAFSMKPIVMVPPMLGSQLWVTVKDFKSSHWYCPKNIDNKTMWLNEEYVIPPLYNCLAEYLTSQWDPVAKTVRNNTNVEVYPIDFGGVEGVKYIDSGVLGYHLISDYNELIQKLTDEGYVVRKDLFAAPYDWRHAPLYISHYYQMLKDLIEQAYYMNDNQKVTIFSYSCGCMVFHYFLTHIVDEKWKEKFILKVIWCAPSFGGTMDAFSTAYFHKIDYIPEILVSESLHNFFDSLPTLYSHLPNSHMFPDYPIVYGPNGEEIHAPEIPDFLIKMGKVKDEFMPLMEEASEIINKSFDDPGVSSYFAFNAVLPSTRAFNFSKGFDKDPETIYTLGDGTMQADILYYGCNNWNSANLGKTMLCHDFNNTNTDYSHVSILAQPDFVDVMVEMMMSDNWLVPGRHNVTGSHVPNIL
ncbi:Lecithin:cholesterol acyltransferase family protein [Tritrichomonas foetus]|uniref:Lecithin:cholesterol acyltransferase family protein n=1 Tax=Tritrichomonas foetus TaxID=1144522 RepID=A0A1J4KCE8_9EUKA|nr:Lecithin:cholesterol acyltransferase family protein [Tritrichomonas foetus]|eukprot:OHT07133.1 Lecithin:cholesterol acyltransferase family protein [Tritrichomonas foetus]